MTRRRAGWIATGLALLALASVSIDRGRMLQITDMTGAPLQDVLVVYHHEGVGYNPAHATTYYASSRSLIQGDSAGRVEIPASAHVHWPFPIESHPVITVDLVYAPTQHNALATIVGGASSQPGAFSVERDLATVRLADLSESPNLWEGTLMNMSSIIGRLLGDRTSLPGRRRARPETTALTRVYIGHFAQEYSSFLQRHGDVLRPKPKKPYEIEFGTIEADQRAWEEMVAKDLAAEPRWGDVARRLFAREVDQFTTAASTLR